MKRPTPCLVIGAVLAIVAAFGPAHAQDVTVAQDGARYSMRATDDGTIRLDTRTGETTLCTTQDGRLRCTVSAEERAAYEAEIDALGTRLESLEARLTALESPGDEALSPSEQETVDKAVSMAERAVRGFAGAVKRLKRGIEGE